MQLEQVATIAMALLLVALLAAEATGRKRIAMAAKPAASSMFLLIASGVGAWDTDVGRIIVLGLALGLVGDVLLLWNDKPRFLAGLTVFLAGHLAYVVAFALVGLHPGWTAGAAAACVVMVLVVARWLLPHVKGAMRGPVVAYMVVISAMVAVAVGAVAAGATLLLLVGAALFYASDLAVARNRFVKAGFVNRVWGLPAYYAGQALIAWSAGTF